MPKGHSKTLWADICSKGLTPTMNAEMAMAKNEIVKMEKVIANERDKITAILAHIENDLSPSLQVAKVRIVFSNSLR